MKIILNLTLFISLFTLQGCASKQKIKKNVALEDVTSEDFIKEKQVRYSNNTDQFGEVDDIATEALNKESIQRLKDPTDMKAATLLDEITISCYNKEFDKAFNLIQANHDRYKEHPIFWNQVGTCFMLQGNRRKALLFYNKALEYKTSYAPAYNNLGVMYRLEGQDQKALVAYTRSKKSNLLAKTPRFNLAQIYLEYGLYNQAISMLRGIYNSANNDVEVIAALGTSYLMKGDIKQSLIYFTKIDDDFWSEPHIGINYALANHLSNKKEDSLDVFSEVDKDKLGKWKQYYKNVKKIIGAK